MANTTKKISLFIKESLSIIEGDSAEALAAKNARLAISTAEGQLAALKGKLVDAESEVEEKEEKLKLATYPSEKIKDRKEYWQNIISAKDALEEAEQEVEDIKHSIKYAANFIKEKF